MWFFCFHGFEIFTFVFYLYCNHLVWELWFFAFMDFCCMFLTNQICSLSVLQPPGVRAVIFCFLGFLARSLKEIEFVHLFSIFIAATILCRNCDFLLSWISGMFFKKHCQRHNRPEGWVHLAKVTSWSHITSSNINLDQISSSESRPSINFKISTNISILTKL